MAKLASFATRRIRALSLIGILLTVIILYVATAPRSTRSSPFYTKTKDAIIRARYENDVANAMANAGDAGAKDHPQRTQDRSPTGQDRINDAKAQQEAGHGRLEDTLKERLRVAEVAAKKSAEDKWKGVQDAAEKASKEATNAKLDNIGELMDDQASKPMVGANAKRAVGEITNLDTGTKEKPKQQSPADVVASQIMNGVQRAAMAEILSGTPDKKDNPAPEAAESPVDDTSKTSGAPTKDDHEAKVLREITAARDRQKERLKAEYRNQLRAQEMKRQKAAGAIAVEEKWRKKPDMRNPTNTAQHQFVLTKEAIKAPEPTTPAEIEFQKLLALSPVTIFSKTYCPYSRKAKQILTQELTITPSPYIVELDTHTHGAEIQKFLAERTGRKTVPNVIVAGKSIGGGDDVQAMWEQKQLRDVIKKLAGKRIVAVVENSQS